jgi:hypothetical protein
MQDLASNHIIPYMEQKIRVLNQQVFSLFHYFFFTSLNKINHSVFENNNNNNNNIKHFSR